MKQKDQKFKADIIGPNAQSGRFPAMSAVASAPNPVDRRHSRTRDKERETSPQRTTPTPLAVIAVPPLRNEAIRDLLSGKG